MLSRPEILASPGSARRYAARAEQADIALGLRLARAKDRPGIRAVGAASEIGGWKSLFAISAATLACGLLRRDERLAAAGKRMLASAVLASAVKTTIKRTTHRTRPNVLMETGRYQKGWLGPNVGPWQSFPSGHSALSTAVACAVARAYPELRGIAYAGAAGIIAAQVVRGAHFPVDVAAGALIGVAAEACIDRLAPWPDRSGRDA